MKGLGNIILMIGFASLLFSCERDIAQEGPLLVDLYADFEYVEELTISDKEVDFTNNSVIFNAKFNKQTNWELTITGLSSKGKKMISGLSREMNASNAEWDGTTTELPMFKSEKCLIDLYIPETDQHTYDTVEITAPKTNEGFLIADFEDGIINPDWTPPFVQSGADMSFRVVQDTVAAHGDYYYDMGGAVNWDYLIGLLYIDADAYDNNVTFPLSGNPDEVYFNFMLWVPDDISNAIVLFQFREDENEDGSFSDTDEDMWSYELTEFESGWQHISVKYSDLVNLVNGQPADPNGNALHEPDKLSQIQLLFLADPSTGYSQAFLDYMIFTEGEPLNP